MTRVKRPSQRLTITAGEAERHEHAAMNDWMRRSAGLVPDESPAPQQSGVNAELRRDVQDRNPRPRLKYEATSLVGRQHALLSRLFTHVPKSKKEDR